MKLNFNIGDVPAEFRRSSFSGRAELEIDGKIIVLSSPFDPATHVATTLVDTWHQTINGHEVVIEKRRPVMLAGFRKNHFRVTVDGRVAAEKSGR
jgi:hypothetical protein